MLRITAKLTHGKKEEVDGSARANRLRWKLAPVLETFKGFRTRQKHTQICNLGCSLSSKYVDWMGRL